MRRATHPAILLLLLAGGGAAAATTQDPAAVTAAVRQAVAATVPSDATITLGTVMGAQYMQNCTSALAVSVTGSAPYEQASVTCAQPPWTLYVSVTVAARAPVVVAARQIAAGQVLQPGDLEIRREPEAEFAGRTVFYDPAALAGATALYGVAAGTILTSTAISQPLMVQAGQTATVDVRSANIDISINAVADQPGRVGDSILMTNPSSGQRFHALVTAAGLVVKLN